LSCERRQKISYYEAIELTTLSILAENLTTYR
jgi:hypothetical protein